MCGRYHQAAPAERLGREYDLDIRENIAPRYNIAPTQPIAVVRLDARGRREFTHMRWGFVPSWAKADYLEKLASRPLINARADGIAEKPTFRSAFKRRRCLVPATGFYEWKGEAGSKQPYAIVRTRTDLFSFAGVWETVQDPDGGEIDTVAIITADSGPDVKSLHHREPVVIAPDAYEFWMKTPERDASAVQSLLIAPPAGTWRSYAVSKAVNNARNEGETLIAPV